MAEHEKFMSRCIELARLGQGNVSPNPMVGCVIVKEGKIIGEGYHQSYGQAHAEVHAIDSVENKDLLRHATLYVNLEPCSHWGKTPPCADLIMKMQIPRVVIGNIDTHEKVRGEGINRLKSTGIEVITGVLEKECRDLNARFFTFHEKKRPWVILKWAQTQDGYIDIAPHMKPTSRGLWITNDVCRVLVHRWRAHEDAILVGTNTALADNPSLTTREWPGRNPLRLAIDKSLRLDDSCSLLDDSTKTVIYTHASRTNTPNTTFVNMDTISPSSILDSLYQSNIQSLIVEGGTILLQSFIDAGLWDEARVFIGPIYFTQGVKSPVLNQRPLHERSVGNVRLLLFASNL